MRNQTVLASGLALLFGALCFAGDAPAVPVPETPGAAGSVVVNGRAIKIQQVYARAIPDPEFPGRDRAVLLLSDRTLVADAAAFDGLGHTLEFEGMVLAVSENGRVSYLRVRQGELDYSSQGQKMDAFEWSNGVVKGQETDYGTGEGLRVSYGIAFHAPVAKPPTKKRRR